MRPTLPARLLYVVAIAACALTLAQCRRDETSPSGTWVMTLGNRPFIVITLQGADGVVSHPAHFGLSGDGRFTNIDRAVVTKPLADVTIEPSRIRFSIVNPDDPADRDDYELLIDEPDRGRLVAVGIPFETDWPMTRGASRDAPSVATDWDALLAYTIAPVVTLSNAEMAAIFEEDQSDRQGEPSTYSSDAWAAIARSDAGRRQRVRALIDRQELHTPEDFRKAAFIFQHGDGPRDYLLAHTLALVAISKGDASASWIAAATLDRYLQAVGQSQIYGTQFLTPGDTLPTQEPYDRPLVTDEIRRELGVPRLQAQDEQLKALRER